jgi:murein DD-endopeptidase MepM/ murein hydrolase activator NlpD
MQKHTKYHRISAVIVFALLMSGILIKFSLANNARQTVSAANVQQTQETQQSQAQDSQQAGKQLADSGTAPPAEAQVDSEEVQVGKKPEVIKYTIKTGDTLSAIAQQYHIRVNTILWANGMSANTLLKEGKELTFPSINGLMYAVRSGDTLWDISSTYNTDVADIVDANYLKDQSELKIGQVIILPGANPPQPAKVVQESKPAAASTAVKKVQTASKAPVKVASRGTSASASTSGGMWPVSGTITSRFGMRWGKLHKGIDIAAPTGTDVHASMAGKVTFSGWDNGGYGYLVIIDHGNGLVTYYGHNSKLLVSVGQTVSKGEHIADVGSTGDSTGSHCHFEIRKNGTPVNPLSYLP